MNILFILMGIILILFGIKGYKQGILKQGFNLFFWLFGFGLVLKFTPYVREFVLKQTSLEAKIMAFLQKKLVIDIHLNEELIVGGKGISSLIGRFFEEDKLLQIFSEQGLEGVRYFIYETLARQIITGVIFLASILLVFFLLRTFILGLDLVDKLPVIHQFNRLGGTFIGVVEGGLVCLLVLVFLTIFQGLPLSQFLLKDLDKIPVLERMYQGILMFLSL